jgi:hypothetical protein
MGTMLRSATAATMPHMGNLFQHRDHRGTEDTGRNNIQKDVSVPLRTLY